MKWRYIVVGSLVGFGVLSGLQGQEKCLLHFNKSFFVAGENILGQLYLPPDLAIPKSWVRVSVFLGKKKVDEFLLQNEVAGCYPIYYPLAYDHPAGMYQWIFSTADTAMADGYSSLLTTYVPIFNEFDFTDQDVRLITLDTLPENTIVNDQAYPNLNISYTLDPQTVYPRSEIALRLTINDSQGRPVKGYGSVSIRDKKLTDRTIWPGSTIVSSENIPRWTPLDTLWEIRGHMTDSRQQPYISNFIGGYLSVQDKILYPKMYDRNQFVFHLPLFEGTSAFEVMDQYSDSMIVTWEADILPQFSDTTLFYTEGIADYLRQSELRNKIYQVYTSVDAPISFLPISNRRVSYKPDRVIVFNLYEDFADLPTFFQEISTPLKFILKDKDTYIARMFNPTMGIKSFYPGSPLFIVDDQLTRDGDWVAQLPIDALEQIELYYDFEYLKQHFGNLGYNGLIKIESKTGNLNYQRDANLNTTQLSGLLPNPRNPIQQIDRTRVDEEIPILQPQIYWNPLLETTENGEIICLFNHSDDISIFEIEVVFQSISGQYARKRFIYEVINSEID